jgi:NAD(P)-dependent dehydrogenase (short-subunit alcohol dehydrogenase family)
MTEPERRILDNPEYLKGFNRVLVTGVAQGMGRAMFEDAASYQAPTLVGLDVNAVQINTLGKIHQSVPDTKRLVFATDIADRARLEEIAAQLQREGITLNCLILNAGIRQKESGTDIPQDEQDRIMAVNVDGTRNTFEVFQRLLEEGSNVVFMSSDIFNTPTDLPVYAESKRRIAEYAKEVGEKYPQYRVLTLLPGPINTELFRLKKSEERLQMIDEKVGIMTPGQFSLALFDKILPDPTTYPSRSFVRVYQKGITVVPFP